MTKHDPEHQSALEAWREGKETRAIITPFAFKVDEGLLGHPLGKPWRRGLAMGLDLWLIAMLTYVPDVAIGLVAAIAIWILSKRHDQVIHPWARRWLRVLVVLVVFVLVVSLTSTLSRSLGDKPDPDKPSHSALEVGALGAVGIAMALCDDKVCVDDSLPGLIKLLDERFAGDLKTRRELADAIFDDMSFLNDDEKAAYREQVMAGAEARYRAFKRDQKAAEKEAGQGIEEEKPKHYGYSLLNWAKGLIADLGLGLSWAALYFTLFTALWRGQTPGKRLLGLRVVRLNGEPLTLWASFGRYGGYGAGLATGMLGFMQVLWDNNRQCIQDKIGETVVIQEIKGIRYTGPLTDNASEQQEEQA